MLPPPTQLPELSLGQLGPLPPRSQLGLHSVGLSDQLNVHRTECIKLTRSSCQALPQRRGRLQRGRMLQGGQQHLMRLSLIQSVELVHRGRC